MRWVSHTKNIQYLFHSNTNTALTINEMENSHTNSLNVLKMDHTKEIENYQKRLQDLAEKKETEVIQIAIKYNITIDSYIHRGKIMPPRLQHQNAKCKNRLL